MKSILITGCNRGLGLGLIKYLVKDTNSPEHIIATCRNLEKAKELQEIAEENKNVHILQLDVTKTESFDNFASEVNSIVKDKGLNVLFNNAGYAPKSTRLPFVRAEHMIETYAINTVGPVFLTKALLPLLKKAADVNNDKPMGSSKSAVVNMTSVLGSITDNDSGGLYPYRCSKILNITSTRVWRSLKKGKMIRFKPKFLYTIEEGDAQRQMEFCLWIKDIYLNEAALNMATKSLSIDLKKDGILVTCIHPGWVKTDMGGSSAPMHVATSASGIICVIRSLSEKHNGEFYQWDGNKLEW